MSRVILVLAVLFIPLAVSTKGCESQKALQERFGPSPFGQVTTDLEE